MENKIIPTAEEFLWNGGIITQGDTEPYGKLPNDKIPSVMIEFAKLHVEAALKAASEKAEMSADEDQDFRLQHCECVEYVINKDSILNSYPLENIK